MQPPTVSAPVPDAPPLVVDLDGTLIRTDLLHESSVQLFRSAPLATLWMPVWLHGGKAVLKQQLAQRMTFDASLLPYNAEVLQWLRAEHARGRRLVLCTASDRRLAEAVAAHCGVFDDVMASDGVTNLNGARKARALVERFGEKGFDYAGNATVDLPVWRLARRAVVVDAPPHLLRQALAVAEVEKVFAPHPLQPSTWVRLLRAHHWLKNLLILAPLFAAHQVGNPQAWWPLLLAFASFSLCASSVYVANDLMDLQSDRLHPRKRARPFASGLVPVWWGVALVPALALASLLLGAQVGEAFVQWLGVYFATTWIYSWWFKRLVLVDCVVLAVLYTLRVVAGAAAAGLVASGWLLAFSGFLFLSLAFVKRYAELQVQRSAGQERAHGRGYLTRHLPLVQTLGLAAGVGATVVLALYLNSQAVAKLYPTPWLAWGVVPVMAYWIGRMWQQARRGEMHDDPLVFAFRDRHSLAAGALFGLFLFLGSR